MKVCPTCNLHYDDDTLSFCLDDGTRLTFASQSDTPTAFITDTELVTRVRSGGAAPDPRFMDSQVTHVGSLAGPPVQKSRTALAVILTAVGMILVFVVIGLVGYIIYMNQDRPVASNVEPNRNGSLANLSNVNSSGFPTPVGTPASPTSNSATANATTPVTPANNEVVIKEVSSRINSWKSQAESLDLNSYMGHYASTVDYYRKSGASLAFVRASKQQAFAKYSSIRVNISNISVTTDASGQEATATMDKEWDFRGNSSSSGKVRQLMRFKKINGQWYITAEKDLKVYYTR